MNSYDKSVHISYKLENHEARSYIRDAIISLVKIIEKREGRKAQELRFLDLGCGHGLLMRDLSRLGYKMTGLDFNPVCINNAKSFGETHCADASDIVDIFKPDSFDAIIASHLLEHVENPKQLIEKMKIVSKKYIIIAVPNPVRFKVLLKYSLFQKNYSNKGHFYCWDRSHLTNFLELHCGLRIIKWQTDGIHILSHRLFKRKLKMNGFLNFIEVKFLPRLFPYFSTSLIVLCSKNNLSDNDNSQ